MKIVIDMQGWQASSRNRGIGRYTLSLIREMLNYKKKHDFVLMFNGAFEDSIREFRKLLETSALDIRIWYPVLPTGFIHSANKKNRILSEKIYKEYVKSLDPDFFLVTSIFEGLSDDVVVYLDGDESFTVGVILYDLIPMIYQDIYLSNDVLKEWYFSKAEYLKKSDYLFSISKSAAGEATDYLKWDSDFVCNISTAADEMFKPISYSYADRNTYREKYGITSEFLMYTGGWDYRKNIEKLIESYGILTNSLRDNHQLVIVCSIPEEVRNNLYKHAASYGIKPSQLILTGFVPDEDLVALYNLCHAFIFPSWHEGFGLPVLEAMLCEKPVIASNVSSLPEVLNFEEALFDPQDVNDISKKIVKVLSDQDFRNRIISHSKGQVKNFSWELSAKRIMAAIENTQEKSIYNSSDTAEAKSNLKPSLAFISPLPPEKSGISYYSDELIIFLKKHYAIKLVNDDPSVLSKNEISGCEIISVDEFKLSYSSFDRIVYQIGNSHYHEHMLGLIISHPGVVVLHDFFLSGLNHWMSIKTNSLETFNDKLYHSHGYAAVAFNNLEISNSIAVNKYPCNYSVLSNALAVIFHSDYSLNLSSEWYNGIEQQKFKHIPLLRVPPVESKKNELRKEFNLANSDIVIISLGYIASTKLNHRIITAFEKLHKKHDNIKLFFVGHASEDDNYCNKIKSSIASSSAATSINITGWVDDETYKKWLSLADIGIQLRTMSRGETSAAVLDCMNYGLATIANSNGSMKELPSSCVNLLKDEFSDSEIYNAMETLISDEKIRKDFGRLASEFISKNHSPELCAEAYYDFIERAYNKFNFKNEYLLSDNLLQSLDINTIDIVSQVLADNVLESMPHKIFLDISSHLTDIDQELKDLIDHFVDELPKNIHLEPVQYDEFQKRYIYSQSLMKNYVHLNETNLSDDLVDNFRKSTLVIFSPLVKDLLLAKDAINNISINNKVVVVFTPFGIDLLESDISNCGSNEVKDVLDFIGFSSCYVIHNELPINDNGFIVKNIEGLELKVPNICLDNVINYIFNNNH